MRYLKKFKIFLEADLQVGITDSPDVKMAKEKFNVIQKNIAEYKSTKDFIKNLYLTKDSLGNFLNNDLKIKTTLDSKLGKTDIQNGKDRNPFLVEYLTVINYQRKIDSLRKKGVDDKIKLDDFQMELRNESDEKSKTTINQKINQIKTRMSEDSNKINQLLKDFDASDKALNKKMLDIQSDLQAYMTKIS